MYYDIISRNANQVRLQVDGQAQTSGIQTFGGFLWRAWAPSTGACELHFGESEKETLQIAFEWCFAPPSIEIVFIASINMNLFV